MTDDRPKAPFGRRSATVTAVERLGAYSRLEIQDPDAPIARAGQFHMLSTGSRWGGGEGERPFLPRALSFASSDGQGGFAFILEAVGPGTDRLCSLQPGESVNVVGPLGNGFDVDALGTRPILVAGGIGLAPILALADELRSRGADYDLILGFRSGEHAKAATHRNDCRILTDDGSFGEKGSVDGPVRGLLEGRPATVAACGPPAMLEAIRGLCADHGVEGALALEAGMACGFGSCFGCAVETLSGTIRLCLDGPVLKASALSVVTHTGRNAGGGSE